MISVKSEPLCFDTDEQHSGSSFLPELEIKKLPCLPNEDTVDPNNNSLSTAANMQVTKHEASPKRPDVDLNFETFIQRYSANQKDDAVEISSDEYEYTPTPITDLVETSTDSAINSLKQEADGKDSWKRSFTVEEYRKISGKISSSKIIVLKPYHCDENACNASTVCYF